MYHRFQKNSSYLSKKLPQFSLATYQTLLKNKFHLCAQLYSCTLSAIYWVYRRQLSKFVWNNCKTNRFAAYWRKLGKGLIRSRKKKNCLSAICSIRSTYCKCQTRGLFDGITFIFETAEKQLILSTICSIEQKRLSRRSYITGYTDFRILLASDAYGYP